MKFARLLVAVFGFGLVLLVSAFALAARADVSVNLPVLPNSGTYFIVSASSGEALQPAAPSLGQNVLLYPYTHAGAQKWTITRKIDPKTKRPTNRYTIRFAGEVPGLNFQPHPVAGATSIISSDSSTMVLEPGAEGMLVKSVSQNGDALYTYPVPEMNTEARFGPNDGSTKFRWLFEPAG